MVIIEVAGVKRKQILTDMTCWAPSDSKPVTQRHRHQSNVSNDKIKKILVGVRSSGDGMAQVSERLPTEFLELTSTTLTFRCWLL